MIKYKSNKFLLRFFIIFFAHLIFVMGDYSMDVFVFTAKRSLFFIFFMTYWLSTWYIADCFNSRIYKKQSLSVNHKSLYTYFLFFSNFVFGLLMAFIFNLLYRYGDVNFFGDTSWNRIPLFNPELTLSLFSIYMMIFTADIFFNSVLKRKEDEVKMEKLRKENALAQYLVLKSQIEPHFLFNSLSVLSSFIKSDADMAEEFLLRLSKTLRYVIEKNELTLVPLKEEIGFVEDYFFLIRQRFDKGILFENLLDKQVIKNCYIPPASLQLLIENAVKHNKFTSEEPLQISIFNDDKHIFVKNNINLRNDNDSSTNQGLQNLIQRFSFFSESTVNIEINETDFTASLPILTKTEYEHFNI